MKKLISVILTLAMLLGMTAIAADDEIKVLLDGERIKFDVQPIIENDCTLVPMRTIAEKLGAEVEWKSPNVFIIKERKIVMLSIGSKDMSIDTFSDSAQKVILDTPPIIVNNRTLVPLRAISEAFGSDVQWDGETKTVTIATKKNEAPMLREYKILNGRLKMSEINDWNVNEGFSGSDTRIELHKNNSYIMMTARELGCMTAGDLTADVNNLGYEMIGEITSQNDIEFVCIFDETSDTDYRKKYLVKSNDNYLILIDFNSELKDLSINDIEKEVRAVMESMKQGELKLDISAQSVQLDYLTINKPEGYFANLEYGTDFDGWRIKKVVSSEVQNAPSISIYYGYEPTYDELYKGSKPYKTVKSKFIGNKIEWLLYKEDNYMQAIYKDENLYYHLYAYTQDAEQQQEFIDLISTIELNGAGKGGKPVIYLYPEKEQEINVKLDLDGKFTFTYPEYNNGWTVIAKPDGTIISGEKEYSYLFWEGEMLNFKPDFKEGFVVKGSDSAEFLQKTLSEMGLTPKEYNEFIVYWAPQMQENEYNKIYFAKEEYEQTAKLEIIPEPDSVLRVFMVYEPATADTVLQKQEIKPFERKGFTVVEWGGYLKK
ncbi:copper amine oxidase N-terminal domain-containing protein [Lachnospiraceae bacterium MD329]|nr:copper amine oxidase N-terminal domain-containing protein [Lachnospiraceae bacterium MD329]